MKNRVFLQNYSLWKLAKFAAYEKKQHGPNLDGRPIEEIVRGCSPGHLGRLGGKEARQAGLGLGAAGEAGALGCEGEGPRPMWGGRATRPAVPASSSRRTETRPAARKAMRAGSGRGMAGGVWDGADPADPGRIHPFPVAAAAERLHGGGYLREEGIGGVSTRSEGGEG